MGCIYQTKISGGYYCSNRNRHVSFGVCAVCNGAEKPCIPHATWCARFGLPTDEATCAACTAAREDRTIDPETGLMRSALHLQRMRDAGIAYGAATCQYRQDTGEYREERCCGGRVKQVPIVRCAKTGREANCRGCPEKLAQGVVSTESGA